MFTDFDLIVRRSARYDIALRAKIAPTQMHASAVRLNSGAGAKAGFVEADVLDFSGGGIGLLSMVFFPRKSSLRIIIQGLRDGEPDLLDAVVRVQRVVMSDRRPAYLIGTSFESLNEAAVQQVNSLLDRLGDDSSRDTSATA